MNEQPQNPSRRHSIAEVLGGFVLGIGLVAMCNFLLYMAFRSMVSSRLCWIVLWLIFGFGVTQLIYMVPAILVARRRGNVGRAKGLIIAASLAFLLNGSCFVLFWIGGRIGG